jgi:AcrR family transcriptional regulator
MTRDALGLGPPHGGVPSTMKSQRIDIAKIRRDQIVEAAVAVIAEQGLQNLSLSEIENKAGMSRGQLTYYFPTKEDILLAVFDWLVLLIHQRIGKPGGQGCDQDSGWEWVAHLLDKLLTQPPVSPEFACLQYTFLSQISHRADFRQRLATLYEGWRSNMALGLSADLARRPAARQVSPRALATLVQAILHGLGMQRAADPDAFDREEMLELCLDVLSHYLWDEPHSRKKRKPVANKTTAGAGRSRARRAANQPNPERVNGERTHP